jgi:transcriptional regulator with XRE-family HTH domain
LAQLLIVACPESAMAERMRDETGIDGVGVILFFCRNFLQNYSIVQAEKTENLQNFAFRLRGLAERRGLKQIAIARALGVNGSRVGNWFQGLNYPKDDDLQRLAALLRVPPEFLVSVTDQQESGGVAEDQARYSEPERPPVEPTEPELTRYFIEIAADAAKIPGGLYQLQRSLKRFAKEYIDPIE